MALGVGARLGPYEVLSALGAGGMGEVYKARDTRLDRTVAIKILPPGLATDPDLRARFEREARAIAALDHPHICAVHDVGEHDGTRYLVMQYLDGETLAARLARTKGPLPVDQALKIGVEIADALDKAHRAGITHRDLKPANIMLTKSGAKLLDFGLAKLRGPAAPISMSGMTRLATPTPNTAHGTILGTVHYMAPEQVEGREADARADIWALGVVLYEMLTGARPFDGASAASVIGSILKDTPPPIVARQPLAPATLDHVVARCLDRDPDDRWQTASDVKGELRWISNRRDDQPITRTTQPVPFWRRVMWPLAAAVFAGLVTLLGVRASAPRSVGAAPAVTRLELVLPSGIELYGGVAPALALAPDGRRVAYIGSLGGERRIYVRSLDRFDSTVVPGTDRAQSLFFSPDGSAIGFMSNDRSVKKVSLSDGFVTVVARGADQFSGGTWSADGRIIFSRDGSLVEIPAGGGSPRALTTLNAGEHELFHIWPVVLPGDAGLLFRSVANSEGRRDQIEALVGATRERKVVLTGGGYPLYAPSGHLVFARGSDLLAMPFDVRRMQVTGPAVRAVTDVGVDLSGGPLASVAPNGSLAYAPAANGTSHLVWVTRQGVEQPIADSATRYQSPRLAANGRTIVVQMAGNLWLHDLTRGTITRVTPEAATVGSGFSVWAPDGRHLAFRSRQGMRWLDVDAAGGSRPVSPDSTSVSDVPTSISPDGETLVFMRQNASTSSDIYAVSLRDGSALRPILNTPAYEGGAQLSPNGHWLAYVSDDSGRPEVYIRSFQGSDRRWPVSTGGGSFPLWRRDGNELFYRAGNRMMAVTVTIKADEVTLSAPRALFDRPYPFETSTIANYDISLDGTKFLMAKDDFGAGRLNVILNWTEELKQRVPLK
jgi:serine/threonine-protein kinase